MFEWLCVISLCVQVLSVDSQIFNYAVKRVLNQPLDFQYQAPMLQTSQVASQQPEPGHADQLNNVRTIILMKKVPVPYPVHVEKRIPFPVKVPMRRPYIVYVPKPYQVEVTKQIPVPVKVPYAQPYAVEKHVPVPYKVHYDRPVPVQIPKPYPVFFEKRVPVQIEKPVPVPYRVPVDRPFPVQIPVENTILFPVEKPVHYPVRVPVEKAAPSLEKPQLSNVDGASYFLSTQPTVQSTFSPSPYDEFTSNLITQGKHKVISFLPGPHNYITGSSESIGSVHDANVKTNDDNSTDWVPKSYVPTKQFIPFASQSQSRYVLPTQETPSEVQNTQRNSVQMRYKLHYDPRKKEYSFQIVPETPGAAEEQMSFKPADQHARQSEFPYRGVQQFVEPSSGFVPVTNNSYKTHVYTVQQSAQVPNETHKDLDVPFTFQSINTGAYVTGQADQHVNAASYDYSHSDDGTPTYHQLPFGPEQHESYSYQSVDHNGKMMSHNFAPANPVIRYAYVPQASEEGNTLGSESQVMASYQIPNQGYPQVMYQTGKTVTISRDGDFTTTSTTGNLQQFQTEEGESDLYGAQMTSEGAEASNGVQRMSTLHVSNLTDEDTFPSTIKFQKFGYADVVPTQRTEAAHNFYQDVFVSTGHPTIEQRSSVESDLEDDPVTTTSTEPPISTKVYRLSTYKLPEKKNNDVDLDAEKHWNENQPEEGKDEDDKPLSYQWFEFLENIGGSDDQETGASSHETNSHTGAAIRAPFEDYSTSTATTTASSSLQAPERVTTPNPTQSLSVTRRRGSVRAYGRKAQQDGQASSTTETPSSSTKGSRRRKRPSKRRVDKDLNQIPAKESNSSAIQDV